MSGKSRRTMQWLALQLPVVCLTGCSLLNQLVPGSAPVRDAETGQITEGNTNAEVFSIRVGDCLNTDDTMSGEISSVPVVPCDQPHADEVFLAYDLEDAEFPGTDEVANAAYERCAMEFEAFDTSISIFFETMGRPSRSKTNQSRCPSPCFAGKTWATPTKRPLGTTLGAMGLMKS